jgi:hypothetical protein
MASAIREIYPRYSYERRGIAVYSLRIIGIGVSVTHSLGLIGMVMRLSHGLYMPRGVVGAAMCTNPGTICFRLFIYFPVAVFLLWTETRT